MVFMSIPYHRELSPSGGQLARVLVGGPSLVVRFPSSFGKCDRQVGVFMCTDKHYDLSSLHKKSRNQTRRGLDNCTVERLQFPDLERDGINLNVDTYRRQGKDPRSFEAGRWRTFCRVAGETRDVEAWGAWVKGSLAAFAVTALIEDSLYIYTQASATEYLEFYPNNALTFLLTKQKLALPGVRSICYGVKTLTRPTLDEYKMRMGFEVKTFGERIVFNPLLRLVLSLGGDKAVHWIAKRRPEGGWGRLSLMLDGRKLEN